MFTLPLLMLWIILGLKYNLAKPYLLACNVFSNFMPASASMFWTLSKVAVLLNLSDISSYLIVLKPRRIFGSIVNRLLGRNNKPASKLAPSWVPEVSAFRIWSSVVILIFCNPP